MYMQDCNKHRCGNGGRNSKARGISGTEEKGEIPLKSQPVQKYSTGRGTGKIEVHD